MKIAASSSGKKSEPKINFSFMDKLQFVLNVGPSNVGHLFDHLLWSIFHSMLYTYVQLHLLFN